MRAETRCVNEQCERHRRQEDGKPTRGEMHEDKAANVADWRAERRFKKDTPLERCR